MTDDSSRAADVSRPNDVRWVRRPIAGWVVRAAAVVVPLVVSIGLAWVLTAATPAPATLVPAIVRWVAIAAVSSLVLVVLERAGRRLMPIAALLDLTLVFPDRAPSRFRMALRTGTTMQLHRRVEEARTQGRFDTPAEAAERVIELVAALRVHDHITRGHSERVRAYTQMIADEMGVSDAERDRLRWAGLLHDVGKLLVPTSILNKQGRLTVEEYRIVQAHPENGRHLIEPLVPWLGESARAVWEHHEKWDGTGYPHGLAGEEISRAARIVAVADVYDVLTSARSYKAPVSPTEARAELARCAGSHFDPVVVRAFLNLSIGRVRRAAGPLSWLAQLTLFPTAVLSSGQAAGSAVVLTGALGASSAGIGPDVVQETFSLVDPRNAIAWHQDTAADGEVWEVLPPRSSTTTTTVSDGAGPFTSGELIAVGAVGAVGDDVGSGGRGSTTVPTTAPSTITPPSAGSGDEPDPAAGGGGTDSPPGAVAAPTTTTTTAVPATTPPPTTTTIAPPTVTTPTVPPTTTPTVPPTTTPTVPPTTTPPEVDQPVPPTTTTTTPAVPDPPGQGGTPPGQGGTPPGQGGTPPGQGGTPPGGGRGRTGG